MPTRRYSGRIKAVSPNKNPGTSHLAREEPSPSDAQRKARTPAGRVNIAGGSLYRAPTEWMNGG